MALNTITNTVLDLAGNPVAGTKVSIRLVPGNGFRIDTGTEVSTRVETTTDGSGIWSQALEANANITPANSFYIVEEARTAAQGGPVQWAFTANLAGSLRSNLLVSPPPQSLIAYLDVGTGDARYQALGSIGSAVAAVLAGGAGTSGVSTAAARGDHVHPLASGVPERVGTASAQGASTSVPRLDHVHGLQAGAPTAYTPTLTAATLGNGTITGSYKMLTEKICWFTAQFVYGSTSTGVGTWQISLPFAARAGIISYIGTAYASKAASGQYTGPVRIDGGATSAFLMVSSSATNPSLNYVASVVPTGAWAAGDLVQISAIYEIA